MRILTAAATAWLAYFTVRAAATWPLDDAILMAVMGFVVCVIGIGYCCLSYE